MNRKQRIAEQIHQSLQSIAHLDVVDESYMHAVPANAESHFKLLIVSSDFASLSMIERHRLINQLFAAEFNNGLHALSLHTWTPEEWVVKGGVLPTSPPCLGGSKVQKSIQNQ
ncbi:BolA family transcriptional regulator [Chromatium weissei]|nr:BolA family transcriptional regulator [Chromatium weissei]